MLPVAATIPFLSQLVALFVASVVIAYISYRLRLVTIAGFLIAGVVIGPNAVGLVSEQALVDVLAEVGVVLLLFTIGVEFSLAKLAPLGRAIFVGGGIQVGLAIGAVSGILAAFGVSWQAGVYTGCLVALSSTAIVLGLLSERRETDTPGGRLTLALLIFQDLAIVLMVLIVPMLAGSGGTPLELLGVLGRALALIAVVLVFARRVVPWVLEQIVRTRRQELFLLTVVAICFGTAAVSSLAGVSLALGAFLAGLVVSESRYSEQALSEVLPLRTIFNAVFFVSVGMLLDLRFVAANLPLVLGVAALVVAVKLVTATVGVLVLGYPVRIAAAVGLALAQIGEFSFVLERAGRAEGLAPMGLAGTGEQVFIAATVLLMLLTPLLVTSGPRLGIALARTRLRHLSGGAPSSAPDPADAPMEDHVIVVGYGPTGERLVQVLGETGIPSVVVEMNPEAVRRLEAAGQTAIYGDGTRAHILETAGIHRAKMVVAVVNDPPARARIVQLARYLNPTVQVVARARYLSEVDALQALGADIVVPEEMETTVRIFTQVLGAYMVPPAEIEAQVRAIRAQDYGVMRGSIQEAHLMVLQGLDEEGMHTRAVAVRAGAPAAGQTLEALALRRDHHLTVLAVRRGAQTVASPAGSFTVEPGDRLVMVGRAAHFADCAHLFRDLPAAPAEA